jgi:hypothetical protein
MAALALAGMALFSFESAASNHNTLTAEEQQAGWKLLFDGKTTEGWRGFRKQTPPEKGWVVEEGCLKKIARVRGGDIVSLEQFTDFELQWDWKIPAKANNGIKYFITESRTSAIGHEYQMIDDSGVKVPKHRTASFYDVLPPGNVNLKPMGEWNHSRILVRGNQVEHWLNGDKVLAYELGSPEVLAAVQNSKFKDVEGFGTKITGHILLTDHTDEAWFRNIKIRRLHVE